MARTCSRKPSRKALGVDAESQRGEVRGGSCFGSLAFARRQRIDVLTTVKLLQRFVGQKVHTWRAAAWALEVAMDEVELWAAVVVAETQLRQAQGALAESEIEPHSEFGSLDELRNQVAVAAVALARAQHRWNQRASGSPCEK